MRNTFLVNIHGGPCSGKTTLANELCAALTRMGLVAEVAREVAKDFTWEGRLGALECQPLVFGQQLWRLQMLMGKVDVVIMDCPLIASCIYDDTAPTSFRHGVFDYHERFAHRMDIFLKRAACYTTAGRNQTLAEAILIDDKIWKTLCGLEKPVLVLQDGTVPLARLAALVQDTVCKGGENI